MMREVSRFLPESDLGNLSKVSKTVHSDLMPEIVARKVKYQTRPPTKILANGTKIWTNSTGQLHQVGGPAVILPNGDQEWCRNGKLDRVNGPAVILSEGDQFWIQDNRLHREDGPAVILVRDNGRRDNYLKPHSMEDPISTDSTQIYGMDGDQRWFAHGKLNRGNDLPAVVNDIERRYEWWVDDKRHRIGNPAIIDEGMYEGEDDYEEWWVNGDCNREDGPAIYGGDQPVWCCAGYIIFCKERFDWFMQTQFHTGMYPVKKEENKMINLATGEVSLYSDTWRLLSPSVKLYPSV